MTDDKVGMVAQAMGLAEAIGFATVRKTIAPAWPWKLLPASVWPAWVSGAGAAGDPVDDGEPDLVVSCGRHAVGPALWVKRRCGGRPFLVHVQHPRVDPGRFDLIVAPKHDRLKGPNVIPIRGALNGVTEKKLEEAAARFAPTLAHLPRPLVAVLLGGDNSVYRLTDTVAERLLHDLRRLCAENGAGLVVTPSRRTTPAVIDLLRHGLCDMPAKSWDSNGENPYLGYLALADAVLVTGDSVNMVSEACATGKPVYVVQLEGGDGSKFADFHRDLQDAGITRPFDGRLETWSYPPLNETERVAEEIRRRLEHR